MKSPFNIAILGAAGRMGKALMRIADEKNYIPHPVDTIIHNVEVQFSNPSKPSTLYTNDLKNIIDEVDVVIDFTTPSATLKNLQTLEGNPKPLVIGTTGFSEEQKAIIVKASKKIPIVFSSNMSIGVNVMWKILEQTTKALGAEYDIEVLEMHHRHKKDSPSGTAMTTAEVLAKAAGRDLAKDAVYARHGIIGERKNTEIGIQTLRGGDVVGDHTVYFAGIGERLEITHRASSRDTFAAGAIRAAEWLLGKPAALYNMQDVLGLK